MVLASDLVQSGGSPFVEPGSSTFSGGAPNTWVIDPATNVNGAEITSLIIYKHSVAYGPDTANLSFLVSDIQSASYSLQNVPLPAGTGLRGVSQGTSGFLTVNYNIL